MFDYYWRFDKTGYRISAPSCKDSLGIDPS